MKDPKIYLRHLKRCLKYNSFAMDSEDIERIEEQIKKLQSNLK